MKVITRFAPSPTGFLHVGNVRTALTNWLFARSTGGKFILRIDDTDQERSRPEFEEQIKRDLTWLGLDWDDTFRQSSRQEKYNDARDKLITQKRLYPCFETSAELALKKKMMLNKKLPPIYDRAALKLSEAEKQEIIKNGISPHWRFFLQDGDIKWDDGIRGELVFHAQNISDPVLIRADGTMTYSLASVVDDIDYGITHIIRGEDHISNSAMHIQMFQALGARAPEFAHTSLLKSKDGEMSKRLGGFDIKTLREKGVEPMALLSFLAKIGTSDSVEMRASTEELIAEFALSKFGKAPAFYDEQDLLRLNTKYIHHADFNMVKNRLQQMGLTEINEEFWLAVRPNLNKINEVEIWWDLCSDALQPEITNPTLTKLAASLLPENLNADSWNLWIAEIQKHTDLRGKNLFMPLRLALTGMSNGPELKYLLPLIPRNSILKRLNG